MAGPESLEQEAPAPASRGAITAGLRLHRGHAFGGMEILDSDAPPLIVARCECGAALDVAEAVLVTCPRCAGEGRGCRRCGDTGGVVDHAALEWRSVEEWKERYGGRHFSRG